MKDDISSMKVDIHKLVEMQGKMLDVLNLFVKTQSDINDEFRRRILKLVTI